MTPEDLRASLQANDAPKCIALFSDAPEVERRRAAKTAASRLKEVTAHVLPRFMSFFSYMSDENLAQHFPAAVPHRGGLVAAQVAVLATASLPELKKFGARCFPPIEDAVAILSDRRPPWVAEWAGMILSWHATAHGLGRLPDGWSYVRRLIRKGLCARPHGNLYIEGMIETLSSGKPGGSVRRGLLEDSGLLDEEIWEIFETEPTPGRLELLPVRSSASSMEHRWEVALAALAKEGRISRSRLLDASLDGLERDFHELRARWFALMHETLRPTPDERAGRAGRYLGLAASRSPSTVTTCLKALAALEKADGLESRGLPEAIGPALTARAKGTVLSALGLLDRAADRDPESRPRAAIVAVEALSHESPEVHKAVFDLIERHGQPADPALADLLQARSGTVSASERGRLATWLGPAVEDPGPDVGGIDRLLSRASAIDPRFAGLAGVGVAVEVLRRGVGDFPALDFRETEVPRLDPGLAVAPVDHLDELIGLFSSVLENPERPEDVERVLDGVSRLCDRIPADFAMRTGPLLARAEWLERRSIGLAQYICGLAIGWATGLPRKVSDARLKGSIRGVFASRVHAIAQRASARQAAPLLGAPTHRGGWIDPRVLVDRVRTWQSLPCRPDRVDGSLAILRLAPDPGPRAEALRSAAGLEGHFAGALRHALGGDGETVGPDLRIWVAAARARAPFDDDHQVEARHPGLGPDSGLAARRSLRPGPHPPRHRYDWWKQPLTGCETLLPTGSTFDLPTVLLHDLRALDVDDVTRWATTIWPVGRESFFSAGIERILGLDHSTGYASSIRPFLEPLLDPDVPLRPMARYLLIGSLSANINELQGLATDALIAAVDDGRIDGRLLGEALQRLLAEGLVKPARLAKTLRDAARVSPLHARVISLALQFALVGRPSPPKAVHLLLELLKELLLETGEGLSVPEAQSHLRVWKSSSKTGRLARDLLGLAEGSGPSIRLAAARALEGRVERAERWARNDASDPIY